MNFGTRRQIVLILTSACAIVLISASAALASNSSLLSTFKSFKPKFDRDEIAVAKGLLTYSSKHQARPVVTALRHEVSDINALTGQLEHQSASNARGTTAKTDITSGLKLIATAYSSLATELHRSSAGKPVRRAKVRAAIATDKKGRGELLKGVELLA